MKNNLNTDKRKLIDESKPKENYNHLKDEDKFILLKSLFYSNNNMGHFTPKKTYGLIKIDFNNLSNFIKPYAPIGMNENTFNEIELTKADLYSLESLRLRIKDSMKYNDDEIFQLSLSIFLISIIIKKPIFKLIKELNI